MIARLNVPIRALLKTPWGQRAGFLAGALATAALIMVCVQQVAILAFSVSATFEENWAVQAERRSHVVIQARAQAIALTGLAKFEGAWSAYQDGANVQVLIKGSSVRTVPRPTGLDLPQHHGEPDSTIIVGDGAPQIRIRHLSKLCGNLLGNGNLLHFMQGPVEYSRADEEGWVAYDKGFECPVDGIGDDAIRLRPALPKTQEQG